MSLIVATYLADALLSSGSLDGDAAGEPHPMLEVLNIYPEQFRCLRNGSDGIPEWVNEST